MAESASASELRETVENLVWQFSYRIVKDGRRALYAGGLSALEEAFRTLGWENPHAIDDGGCDWPGCVEWGEHGLPTPAGYRWYCSSHGTAEAARQRQGSQ